MPLVELTAEELNAIDIACMHLLEAARRGRKKQQDYISIDNDSVGAEWMAAAVQSADTARVTLRALIAKAKEVSNGRAETPSQQAS